MTFSPSFIRKHIAATYNSNVDKDHTIHEYIRYVQSLENKVKEIEEAISKDKAALCGFESVENLYAHAMNEERWANYYCRKLVDLQREGKLPKDFIF
jgi:hypothetical protein